MIPKKNPPVLSKIPMELFLTVSETFLVKREKIKKEKYKS